MNSVLRPDAIVQSSEDDPDLQAERMVFHSDGVDYFPITNMRLTHIGERAQAEGSMLLMMSIGSIGMSANLTVAAARPLAQSILKLVEEIEASAKEAADLALHRAGKEQ